MTTKYQGKTRDEIGLLRESARIRYCASCQHRFPAVKGFEKHCPSCFKIAKGYTLHSSDVALVFLQHDYRELEDERDRWADFTRQAEAKAKQQRKEFRARLTRLIGLCHPDKHGGTETSAEMTRWLLALRGQT